MDATQFANGLGINQCWAFSPAFDLIDQSIKQSDKQSTDDPIHILVANTGDVNHVIRSIASLASNESIKHVHFHILESNVESLARASLLLSIMFDQSDLSEERTINQFMEVHHNILISDVAMDRLIGCCRNLTDLTHAQMDGSIDEFRSKQSINQSILSNLDFASMKSRELDELNAHLTYIIKSDHRSNNQSNNQTSIDKLFDQRLRALYTERFDNQTNLIDWDYNYRSIKQLASIIHPVHYRQWRTRGHSYPTNDQSICQANNTLISHRSASMKGRPVSVKGYWHDVVVTPFVAYGIDHHPLKPAIEQSNEKADQTPNEQIISEMYEIRMDQHVNTNETVERANLTQWRSQYRNNQSTNQSFKSRFTIHCHLGNVESLASKPKLHNRFDQCFLAEFQTTSTSQSINELMKPHANLTINTLFYLPMTAEEKQSFVSKTHDRCHAIGWRHVSDFEDELAFVREPNAVQQAGPRFLVYQRI